MKRILLVRYRRKMVTKKLQSLV